MPAYLFKSRNNRVFKRFLSFAEYDASENDDGTFTLDGKIVRRDYSDMQAADKPLTTDAGWPIHSDSAGVPHYQIEDAKREAINNGVPTDFTPDGRAILRDRTHRKQYLQSIGLRDRDGGYGDP